MSSTLGPRTHFKSQARHRNGSQVAMVKTMRVGSGTFDHLSNKSPTKRPAEGITILDDIADEERSASRSANMNTFNKTAKSNKQETASTNDLSQQKAMQSLIGKGFTKKAQGRKESVLLAYEMFQPVINLTSNADNMRRDMDAYIDM